MGKDISTTYTKEKSKKCGRKAHFGKVTVISPKDYGMFLQRKRGGKK